MYDCQKTSGIIINDTQLYTGQFRLIYVTKDTVFSQLSGNWDNITDHIIRAGTVLRGTFTAIKLKAGQVSVSDAGLGYTSSPDPIFNPLPAENILFGFSVRSLIDNTPQAVIIRSGTTNRYRYFGYPQTKNSFFDYEGVSEFLGNETGYIYSIIGCNSNIELTNSVALSQPVIWRDRAPILDSQGLPTWEFGQGRALYGSTAAFSQSSYFESDNLSTKFEILPTTFPLVTSALINPKSADGSPWRICTSPYTIDFQEIPHPYFGIVLNYYQYTSAAFYKSFTVQGRNFSTQLGSTPERALVYLLSGQPEIVTPINLGSASKLSGCELGNSGILHELTISEVVLYGSNYPLNQIREAFNESRQFFGTT